MEPISDALFLHHPHCAPLTPQPHINAVPVHLGGDAVDAVLLRNDPRCREAVEDGLDRCAAVVEGDVAQITRIHELDALTKLAVTEFLFMDDAEGRARRRESCDAVDAEDGRELLAPVRQIGDEVEVVLGEHDGDRVHLMFAFRAVLTAVGDADGVLCRHVLREFPDRGEEFFPVAQRDIVMLLAADDLPHLFTVMRCSLPQQLLEEGIELLLAERAALEQYLADGEHILVRQPLARRVCEQVAAATALVDDGGLALIGARLREIGAQLLDVTLDGLVRHGKFLRQLCLVDDLAPAQTLV